MKFNLNFPQQTAIIYHNRRFNYRQFNQITSQIGASLIQLGIEIGDRIALYLPNSPEIVFCYAACFKVGAVAVPINIQLKAREIKYIIDDCQAKICICQANLFPAFEAVREQMTSIQTYFLVKDEISLRSTSLFAFSQVNRFEKLLKSEVAEIPFPQISSDAIAAILYTSGTTGRAKGVIHTHRSLEMTAIYHAKQVKLTRNDVCAVVSPLYSMGGLSLKMLAALIVGATLVIIPSCDRTVVLEHLQQYQVTHFGAIPILFKDLSEHPHPTEYNLSALRICISGGDLLSATLQQRFSQLFGVEILNGCGMTEVVPYTLNPPEQNRVGSIGQAALGMKLRIVDHSSRDLLPGQIGEILVQSQAMTIGYWNQPDATTSAFKDGWFYTGDLASMDRDGYYWFVSRKQDLIVRGGSNISPLEVEQVLYQHPGIREAAVIGVPDSTWGEIVRAFVALRVGYSPTRTELQEFIRQRIAAYKVPEQIIFLSELPKGSTSKIQRQKLRVIKL